MPDVEKHGDDDARDAHHDDAVDVAVASLYNGRQTNLTVL